MNKEQRKHYDKIARLGCILCQHLGYGPTPCEIHHIRRFGGKRSNAPAIPLCAWHHRLDSRTSVHGLGHKGFTKYWGLSEEDLLERLNDLLQKKS